MNNQFSPEYLILHDYGGTPGAAPSFNPYHALVSGGRINYRDPKNPYGAPAPHAYKLNPKSIGLSWGGPVGGKPSKEEFALIKQEFDAIRKQFPNIKVMSHGEAFQQTRGTGQQASKLGRGLDEASWRKYLLEDLPYEPGTVTPEGPTPMGQRSLTAYAGVSQTQPSTKGAPTPMPSYKNVGGQTYMGPEAAQQSRRLAEMLINQGTNQEPMTHWTQALGKVLMTGSGALRNDMAMNDVREGQAAGNQALASMLMGGDASAAMTNPYSQGDALQYQTQQKMLADRTAAAERLKRMELDAKNADPLRQLQIEKLRKEISAPATAGGGPKLPTGYTWNDPANPNAGVKRLPGFEQTIPGEVAGKVAQMSDAKERIAKTRSIFEKDWSAGDAAKWAAGNLPVVGDVASLSGDIGIAQRDVRVGIEAALRTMTGAAAPEQEVQRYMQMYMPTPLDTKESAKQKLDGLISFMDKAEKIVMQGRGEIAPPALDATALQGRGSQPLLDKEGWMDVGGVKIREKR